MARSSRFFLPVSSLALLLAATLAPRAEASGFQLRDQSGSGQGNAYAGASAGGSDISSMFFNPAILTRYQGTQLQFGLTEILPSSKLSNAVASRSNGGGSISGATSTGNIAKSATLPTLYALWSLNEDLKLAISVNVPFGLTTEYDPNWAGRYQSIKSHLETLDITPTVAYRLSPEWSVGLSVVARHAKAELSQAIDAGYVAQETIASVPSISNVGSNGQPVVAPGAGTDGRVTVRGSSWAYGYKLGLLYEPSARLRVGLGYQSEIHETLKGTATYDVPSGTLGSALAALKALPANAGKANTINDLGAGLLAAMQNSSVSAELTLPASISLGAIYDFSSTLSLAAEVSLTQWSSFKELRVKFADPAAQPDQVTAERWKDALFVSLGATYHGAGPWTYRAGLALDKSPVPNADRTPRIPDADRIWVSGGVSYQFTRAFGMDAGYSHLFCKDSSLSLQGGSDASNQSKYYGGNLSGTYKNSIDVFAVQARYKF